MKVSNVAKGIVALVTAGVAAVSAVISDGVVTNEELVFVGLALLTALGVYEVPNSPSATPPTE